MSDAPEYSLVLEVHPTAPPIPMGFAVVRGGLHDIVAWLSYEQLKAAIAEYDKMQQRRSTQPQSGGLK